MPQKETMNLKDTMEMMNSEDYKERFKAEYYQLKIRYEKLDLMVDKWSADELDFTPTCNFSIYELQLEYMRKYMTILESRAKIEGIEL